MRHRQSSESKSSQKTATVEVAFVAILLARRNLNLKLFAIEMIRRNIPNIALFVWLTNENNTEMSFRPYSVHCGKGNGYVIM